MKSNINFVYFIRKEKLRKDLGDLRQEKSALQEKHQNLRKTVELIKRKLDTEIKNQIEDKDKIIKEKQAEIENLEE